VNNVGIKAKCIFCRFIYCMTRHNCLWLGHVTRQGREEKGEREESRETGDKRGDRGRRGAQRTPTSYLSLPAFILPLSRTLPPLTGVKVVEGGSVRERGRIKAGGERRQEGGERREGEGRRTE
jgi:hypothetical protein